MKERVVNQNVAVLILVAMLTGFGITGVGYAHEATGILPHFHDDTTTRSVAENVATNTNVGNAVSAHNRGTHGRYVLGGTDASSFSISSTSGQLKTNATLDYETKTSYSVTVTVQQGTLSPCNGSYSNL